MQPIENSNTQPPADANDQIGTLDDLEDQYYLAFLKNAINSQSGRVDHSKVMREAMIVGKIGYMQRNRYLKSYIKKSSSVNNQHPTLFQVA